jgi:HTH-like domain
MVELATQHDRYHYRRVTALLRARGWQVNAKSFDRLWRREGLKVPAQIRSDSGPESAAKRVREWRGRAGCSCCPGSPGSSCWVLLHTGCSPDGPRLECCSGWFSYRAGAIQGHRISRLRPPMRVLTRTLPRDPGNFLEA